MLVLDLSQLQIMILGSETFARKKKAGVLNGCDEETMGCSRVMSCCEFEMQNKNENVRRRECTSWVLCDDMEGAKISRLAAWHDVCWTKRRKCTIAQA